MKYPAITLILCSMFGCASTNEPSVSTQGRVQAYQLGDSDLSCEALRKQIDELDKALAKLSADEETNAIGDMVLSLNGAMGGNQLLGMMQSSLLSFAKHNTANAASGRQQRRDLLMRQHFAKKC